MSFGDGDLHVRVAQLLTENKLLEQRVKALEKERTCKNVHEPPRNSTFWPTPHFKCSECKNVHVSMDYVHYCPNCAAKVVDE